MAWFPEVPSTPPWCPLCEHLHDIECEAAVIVAGVRRECGCDAVTTGEPYGLAPMKALWSW